MTKKFYSDPGLINELDLTDKCILLRGLSGSGKSYFSEQIVNQCFPDYRQIKIIGYPTSQTSYSCLYQGLASFIEKNYLQKERLLLLLKKYTKLIPEFGKYISEVLDVDKTAAYKSFISKVGLSFGASPSVHIRELLMQIQKSSKFLLVLEDVQWIDNSSWEVVDYLISADHAKFPAMIIYNDQAESWVPNLDARISTLEKFENESHAWATIRLSKWPRDRTNELIEAILEKKVKLSEQQLNAIYEKSEGLPLFVESILISLASSGMLIDIKDTFVASGSWTHIEIQSDLKQQIMKRLERVYSGVQNSQPLLEIASVIGDPFDFREVDKVAFYQSSQEIFLNVAKRFKIIEYLFMDRKWVFDHYQTRTCIYESLGSLAKEIHLKVASMLVENVDRRDYLRISYHFAQANEIEKSLEFKLKEVEHLLSIGLFEQALDLADEIELEMQSELYLNEFNEKKVLLRAQCLFNAARYSEVIMLLDSVLSETNNPDMKAQFLRWRGKTFAKLNTDRDFRTAIENLNESIVILKEGEDNNALIGAIYSDLVVAYAHSNKFKQGFHAYKEAEKAFTVSKDRLGLAKLQRRCMIFFEPEVAGPMLVRLEKFFQKVEVHHERIMSLVNASTQFIGTSDFKTAFQLLLDAQYISEDYSDFAHSYIYNNLGVIYLTQGDFVNALQSFDEARNARYRAVERLIIDINEAGLYLVKDGYKSAMARLEMVCEAAEHTSELAYIVPSRLNYAYGLIEAKRYEESIHILSETDILSSEDYTTAKYHQLKCFRLWKILAEKTSLADKVFYEQKYNEARNKLGPGIYIDHTLTMIRFQFWSD